MHSNCRGDSGGREVRVKSGSSQTTKGAHADIFAYKVEQGDVDVAVVCHYPAESCVSAATQKFNYFLEQGRQHKYKKKKKK